MESILILGKGLLTGFLVALPPGAMAVVCIQRTLSKSSKSGFISGLGATTGNVISATIATFFLGIVLPFIEKNFDILKTIFGILIILLGISIFIKNPAKQIKKKNVDKKENLWGDFLSVFLIALANPAFILTYMAFFAFFEINKEEVDHLKGIWLISGVFVGTMLWWLIFVTGINHLRGRFHIRYILYLNKIAGSVIIVLGIAAILFTR